MLLATQNDLVSQHPRIFVSAHTPHADLLVIEANLSLKEYTSPFARSRLLISLILFFHTLVFSRCAGRWDAATLHTAPLRTRPHLSALHALPAPVGSNAARLVAHRGLCFARRRHVALRHAARHPDAAGRRLHGHRRRSARRRRRQQHQRAGGEAAGGSREGACRRRHGPPPGVLRPAAPQHGDLHTQQTRPARARLCPARR